MIAIRKHFKDFVAVIGLILIAGGVSAYILGNQRMRFPLDRGEAVRAEGRVPDRPGRDRRPGPDRARRRRADRRHRRRRAQGRPRDRPHGHRPQVRGHGPHGRDRAAASQDRPEGHVHPARPGHRRRARGEGELDDPGRLDEPGRQPGRDPLDAGLRHARLPAAADLRRSAAA